MTFINPLVDDLTEELDGIANVQTFDSFVKNLCENNNLLKNNEKYFLGANRIISEDCRIICNLKNKEDFKDDFISNNFYNRSNIEKDTAVELNNFVNNRIKFYSFVDPSVLKYRLLEYLNNNKISISNCKQIIIDEFQDFNKLETEIIVKHFSNQNLLLAGDDDQVLFTFKGSNPDCIRNLYNTENKYKSFTLPYCSRCPESIVKFVNKIINYGKLKNILSEKRCDKKYLPFNDMKKGEIEVKFYKNNIKYKIESVLKSIPKGKREVLILYPFSAKNIAETLFNHLEDRGFDIKMKRNEGEKLIFDGLNEIIENKNSNLGYRILLDILYKNKNDIKTKEEIIKKSYEENRLIIEYIDKDRLDKLNQSVKAFKQIERKKDNKCSACDEDELLKLFNKEDYKDKEAILPQRRKNELRELKRKYFSHKLRKNLNITLCSIANSKGLSADYVILFPINDKHFKLDNEDNIFNTIVAITRTRKKLFLIFPENEKSIFKEIYKKDIKSFDDL